MLSLFEESAFVAHNVDFDLSFLRKQVEHEGYQFPRMPVFDTVELSRILLPQQESYKLSHLAEHLGFSHDRPHQADSDAEVTAALFLKLIHTLKQLPVLTLQQLVPLVRKFKSDLEPVLSEMIHEKLNKGEDNEERFDCYRQLAIKRIPEGSSNVENTQTYSFSSYSQKLFAEEGTLQDAFTNYELRPGQRRMMKEVDYAFQLNEHLMIEAGTGTGKSLGYLVPAAFYAHEHQQPVIVSTQTIPLQEQLLTRDLPLLKTILPFSIDVTLLKGRSHYLCLRKFEQSLSTIDSDSYDVILTKALLLIWITETETGDVEELNLPSGGKGFWFEVQSDAASDLGRYNPWFQRCYYHRARRKAQKADLVITNHALLCTDIMNEQGLLPTYYYAVIDEAHHLEETASDHLGAKTDYFTFTYLIQRLGLDVEDEMLGYLYQLIEQYQLPSVKKDLPDLLGSLKEELDELFRMLHGFVLQKQKTSSSDVGRIRYRYQSYLEKDLVWQAILECSMRVHMIAKDCLVQLKRVLKTMQEMREDMTYQDRGFVADLDSVVQSLSEQEDILYDLLLEYDPNYVYWIEVEPRGAKNATFLFKKPIDVSDLLADHFFTKKKSVVLTSATLSVNGTFRYQEKRLGLTDFGVKTTIIPSPFSYMEQVRLLMPTDIPAIKEVGEEAFAEELSLKLWRMMEVSKGKMLVLFTSYDMLKQVYKHVKHLNEIGTYQIIGQGITSGSRAKLTKMFKQSEEAVLFGTSSFWEGIDLPGDELKTLVIVRLPFAPPDQPLLQAQYDKAKEDGRNPFMEISLPQAIIRFKQGFGRLIRTTHDRGCVFVFDRRISTTRYGKQFIRSLPDVPVYEDDLEALLEQFQDYM
ncbi:hypothetical protein BkAM31D_11180 [Halalkalibacter krulwichiae]|uniref:3'-5' exonuclease DinG n=1 Tax=Halalkalibacter krulwichiae TaxID=199441 RepID=A0A1X9MDZ2_9BACI|nr:hypothetical protein BkAM31D_11180 [Halalkalibacter krulwichiae]